MHKFGKGQSMFGYITCIEKIKKGLTAGPRKYFNTQNGCKTKI